jgi:hypothetical protein
LEWVIHPVVSILLGLLALAVMALVASGLKEEPRGSEETSGNVNGF